LGVEALLVKLVELARKKATILCGEGVNFCLFLLLTPVLTRRPFLFKERKKKKTYPPFLVEERERPILLLFIHQIQNQKPISFHSFSTNAKKTEEERPIFLPLHLLKTQRERNLNVLPLETKLSHTELLA
jgi:hypothetical protein